MGKAALLVVIGFTVIASKMVLSTNETKFALTQKSNARYGEIVARTNAYSGAKVALSNLLAAPTWRAGLDTSYINNGLLQVTLTDVGNQIQIDAQGVYSDSRKLVRLMTRYRPPLADFAIFSTGNVTNVGTWDENGNPDSTLLAANEEDLYNIENQALIDAATSQGHVETGTSFVPADGYPNGSFYYSGTTPNVTHVQGDLRVMGTRTVYGIFVVEGDIILLGGASVEGVLYLVNPGQSVTYGGGSPYAPSVAGGIIAYGDVDGTGSHINVQHDPDYMGLFSEYGGDTDASVLVRSWKEITIQ